MDVPSVSLSDEASRYGNMSNVSDSLCIISNAEQALELRLRNFVLVTRVIICPLLCVWSILSGVVNSIAFCKIGLSDGVNQNLLILSVADTVQAIIALVNSVCYTFQLLHIDFEGVTFHALHVALAVIYSLPLGVSIITTTVIAVVRCCCVTMPFTVQKNLTARRQLAAIMILCSFYIVAIFSILLQLRPQDCRVLSGAAWSTWLKLTSAVTVSAFIVIIVSQIILIHALRKSSKFQLRTAGSTSEDRSVRDRRVIKGILQVLIIFAVCNILIIFVTLFKKNVNFTAQFCSEAEESSGLKNSKRRKSFKQSTIRFWIEKYGGFNWS
ncbi:hypothetical protein RRG08_032607 [Elysia crispata]|uniref:G-protein coupled receptors family 1 profile domain-containing protein n=1 Tax=Elysia crispata TaxID=231223 RepID=A0AAE0Y136_9GAST|nr:hypothetical protein RRG08_032607 [Elysia crispata]